MTVQPRRLPFGLDTLRYHRQLQRFRHFNNVRRDVFVLQRIHERFINFERIHVEILQIAQAGVARAKVINIDRVTGMT
jgi:hypothetical protein